MNDDELNDLLDFSLDLQLSAEQNRSASTSEAIALSPISGKKEIAKYEMHKARLSIDAIMKKKTLQNEIRRALTLCLFVCLL